MLDTSRNLFNRGYLTIWFGKLGTLVSILRIIFKMTIFKITAIFSLSNRKHLVNRWSIMIHVTFSFPIRGWNSYKHLYL